MDAIPTPITARFLRTPDAAVHLGLSAVRLKSTAASGPARSIASSVGGLSMRLPISMRGPNRVCAARPVIRAKGWSTPQSGSTVTPRRFDAERRTMPCMPALAARPTQCDFFVSAGSDIAARDAQDLMAWPFFSLAKSKRVRPIDFRMGDVSILVEATAEHGMATIWDADILIWVASQIVEARDTGRATSRLIAATPHEILAFTRRGTGKASYERLKAGLDRLQSTTIATSIRQPDTRRRHRFSWINEWKERLDSSGRALGIEMIIPDWFYEGVIDQALVLTIDPDYFALTGGLERWLYRLVRKHGGRQKNGWSFDFRHLHLKSGALSPLKRFAFELRDIVRRQALPGYHLTIEYALGRERLMFAALPVDPFDVAMRRAGIRPVDMSS